MPNDKAKELTARELIALERGDELEPVATCKDYLQVQNEPKPCPFCGEQPELFDRPCYYYQCVKEKCQAQEVSWNNTIEEAIMSWNHRPLESALQARIEELEKAAVVWHKYPEEKPKPNTRHLVVVNGYVLISRYDAEQDIDKINVTHWADLPAPPKEEE